MARGRGEDHEYPPRCGTEPCCHLHHPQRHPEPSQPLLSLREHVGTVSSTVPAQSIHQHSRWSQWRGCGDRLMLGTRWGRRQPVTPPLNPVTAGLVLTATCMLRRPHRFPKPPPGESLFFLDQHNAFPQKSDEALLFPRGTLISLLILKKDLLFSRPYSQGFRRLKVQAAAEATPWPGASVRVRDGHGPGEGKDRLPPSRRHGRTLRAGVVPSRQTGLRRRGSRSDCSGPERARGAGWVAAELRGSVCTRRVVRGLRQPARGKPLTSTK